MAIYDRTGPSREAWPRVRRALAAGAVGPFRRRYGGPVRSPVRRARVFAGAAGPGVRGVGRSRRDR
ncbi:hypothetical protein AB0D67_04775 [Streptosporangium sp. NPDC048047]|uniref:hypothetical protein n=1 Tax=Streptosporangium sp. NPDC048047 TaxID=3155748 RepID=UPI00343241E2